MNNRCFNYYAGVNRRILLVLISIMLIPILSTAQAQIVRPAVALVNLQNTAVSLMTALQEAPEPGSVGPRMTMLAGAT